MLVVDRYFVHRLRVVTGKDGNALNEVELLCESPMNNKGIVRGNDVVKLNPDGSVVKVGSGIPIRLTADDLERLSTAFLVEIEETFIPEVRTAQSTTLTISPATWHVGRSVQCG